jgi:hypothetical protein
MSKLNQNFDITTSFLDYNKLIRKAMVTIGQGVYITFEPKERTIIENKVETVEQYVDCYYVDETAGYSYDFSLGRGELNQLVVLLSTIRGQLSLGPKDNTGQTSCSRGITIK